MQTHKSLQEYYNSLQEKLYDLDDLQDQVNMLLQEIFEIRNTIEKLGAQK